MTDIIYNDISDSIIGIDETATINSVEEIYEITSIEEEIVAAISSDEILLMKLSEKDLEKITQIVSGIISPIINDVNDVKNNAIRLKSVNW